MRAIPACYWPFIKEEEELRARVYDDRHPDREYKPGDPVDGHLTGGYGHTGDDVQQWAGKDIPASVIEGWLEDDAHVAAGRFERMVGAAVVAQLTEHQYAAMISFCDNLGANAEWTIWRRFKAKPIQFDQVPLELMKFVNERRQAADGTTEVVKVRGLVNRRAAEVALWSTQEPGSVDDTPPSSVTRAAVTPPTPADPVSATKKPSFVAGAIAAVTAAGPMANQISDGANAVSQKIAPYAEHSHYVQHALGLLATVAAVSAAAGLVLMWREHRNAQN